MSHRMSIKNAPGFGGASPLIISAAGSESSKGMREDIEKIQQDCRVLAQRIADLKGEPVPNSDASSVNSNSSPFVTGIRSITESDRRTGNRSTSSVNAKEEKLQALESLIEKVVEYERILLSKTAPEPVVSGVKVRRKSFGSDLNTIPTHLHIADRLVDFHSQSKRVTVIKITEKGTAQNTPNVVSNPADKKTIESLQLNIVKLTKQCNDSDGIRQRTNDEIAQLKRTIEGLKLKVVEYERRPAPSPVPPASNISPEDLAALRAEIAALKKSNAEKDDSISKLHDRLEVEIGTVQGTISVLLGKAAQINAEADGKEMGAVIGGGDDCINLPNEMKNGIHTLQGAITKRLNGLKGELHLIMSVKDLLESDLSTSTTQRDMLQRDLTSVSEEYQALKTAYDSLSYETARSQSMVQSANDTQHLLEKSNKVNEQLESDLHELRRRLLDAEKWAQMLEETEDHLRTATTEKAELNVSVKSLGSELEHYKKLTETLKQKVRDMGSVGNTADSRDFLDTFEEVMREEMMTMKAAFEAKLRLARDEADETSKRHHQEIIRLQSSSPHLSSSSSTFRKSAGTSSSSKLLSSAGVASLISSSTPASSSRTTSDMTSTSPYMRL